MASSDLLQIFKGVVKFILTYKGQAYLTPAFWPGQMPIIVAGTWLEDVGEEREKADALDELIRHNYLKSHSQVTLSDGSTWLIVSVTDKGWNYVGGLEVARKNLCPN